MKLDQLRKIIREEVKAAVKEELQEMLTEAVRVASQPDAKPNVQQFKSPTKIQEAQPPKSSDPIMEMINQTKASMTNSA